MRLALIAYSCMASCGTPESWQATDPFWDDWPEVSSALESAVLDLVNTYREQGAICDGSEYPPVPLLDNNAMLQRAARAHSMDMVERNFFSHTNPDGASVRDRIVAAGYDGRAWGENIARGHHTAEQVMEGWMSSPGHCLNIMRDSFEEIGIGYHERHWTQKFSSPRS